MKNLTTAMALLVLTIALSCSKKNTVTPSAPANTVTINGKAYGTVTIGSQIWTTSNYTGPGGNELYANTADSATTGNYYSSANINLPAGWRVPDIADYNRLLSNYSLNEDNNGNVICDLNATTGLLSKTGWQGITGTNASGFNAYPEGYLNYSSFLKKASLQGANTTAYFLTSTNITYVDSYDGALGVGNVVLMISNTVIGSYHFDPYYTVMESLLDDQLNLVGAASLRFVKDK